MILFPHMLAGAIIGAKTQNWGLIFILAILSHYFFDLLPHWDYLEKDEKIHQFSRKRLFYFVSEVIIDLALGAGSIWLLFSKDLSSAWPYIIWGVFWGIFPDGLLLLTDLTKEKIKILVKHQKFHQQIQYFGKNKKAPFWLGLTVELIIILILISVSLA